MPGEVISTFRKKISIYSVLCICALIALMIATVFLRIKMDEANPFIEGATVIFFVLLLHTGAYLLDRRISRLASLDPSDINASIITLENQIQAEREKSGKTHLYFFIAGGILMITTLLLVITNPHNWFTGAVFTGTIGFILLPMLKGWLLMQDSMMLQDIKHASRDQPSDIS